MKQIETIYDALRTTNLFSYVKRYYPSYIPVTDIPSYEIHHGKMDIFINPHDGNLKFLVDLKNAGIILPRGKMIKRGHRVHLFRAWAVKDDIPFMTSFMVNAYEITGKTVIVHMPRSVDEVSREYIEKSIKATKADVGDKSCCLYIEKDHAPVTFKIDNHKVIIRSIYSHKYDVEIEKEEEE